MSDEMRPRYKLELQLDPDDDALIQTENATGSLEDHLKAMQAEGLIEWYELAPDEGAQ